MLARSGVKARRPGLPWALLLLLGFLGTAPTDAQESEPVSEPEDSVLQLVGPIPLRTVAPLRNLFYQLPPERANTLGHGRWRVGFELSESNVLHIRNWPATEFDADLNLEVSRLNLRMAFGLAGGWDLGAELPCYRFHTGFLDGLARETEELFGKLTVPRRFELEHQGPNAYHFFLKRNGEVFFQLDENTSGVGDLALTAKRQLLVSKPGRPSVSLRAAVKLPTGDEDSAMGSGATDVALGIAVEKVAGRWGLLGNLNLTVPLGSPFEEVGLVSRPIMSGALELERRFGRRFSWHLQLQGMGGPFKLAADRGPSPYPVEPSTNFTGEIIEVAGAIGYQVGDNSTLMLAVYEDILNSQNASSDVTILVALSFGS